MPLTEDELIMLRSNLRGVMLDLLQNVRVPIVIAQVETVAAPLRDGYHYLEQAEAALTALIEAKNKAIL